MTVETLKDCNKKALAQMAKDQGVIGWHAMRKDQLIKALSPDNSPSHAHRNGATKNSALGHSQSLGLASSASRREPSRVHGNGNGHGAQIGGKMTIAESKPAPVLGASSTAMKSVEQRKSSPAQPMTAKGSDGSSATRPIAENGNGHRSETDSLAASAARQRSHLDHSCDKDRIIAMVRDPYWLHVYWELSRSTLDRAKAAMKQDWHTAKPILRLMDITSEDTTCSTERHVRDIEIHGEVNNWYIDVSTPPRSFRVDIGYLARNGAFYVLSRSNIAVTPKTRIVDLPGAEASRGRGLPWPSEYDRDMSNSMPKDLRDLYENRINQPVHNFSIPNLSPSSLIPSFGRDFDFQIDAELIVYGRTEPNAKVTLQGEQVKLRSDGTFSVRFGLPDSRQIIPAVASSPDGVEERTIVLAIERNTKTLEPQIHEANDL